MYKHLSQLDKNLHIPNGQITLLTNYMSIYEGRKQSINSTYDIEYSFNGHEFNQNIMSKIESILERQEQN